MIPGKRILVLIPCLNEESRVGTVVSSVRSVLPQAGILVVNDASSDRSAAEARRAGAILLSHPVHLGYGAALETGYLYAIRHDYDVVLQMDGDGQHLAEELPTLYGPLEKGEADLVIGSRYLAGTQTGRPPFARRLGQKLFAKLIFILTGLRLTDPTSGFQAIGRRALGFLVSGVFPCDYPDADVIIMTHFSGLRIKEVPARMENRSAGNSMHRGPGQAYYAVKMFLSVFVVMLNFRLWLSWDSKFRSRMKEGSEG